MFVTLAFRDGMGYCYLNVRINSANDAYVWYDTAKNGIFSQISLDFRKLFTI